MCGWCLSARSSRAVAIPAVGLIPDGGGSWTLPRLIGMGHALDLMYTGAAVPAAEACAIGLANHLFPTEQFAHQVAAYTTRLAAQAPLALTRIRRAVRDAQEATFAEALTRRVGAPARNPAQRRWLRGLSRVPREARAGVERPLKICLTAACARLILSKVTKITDSWSLLHFRRGAHTNTGHCSEPSKDAKGHTARPGLRVTLR